MSQIALLLIQKPRFKAIQYFTDACQVFPDTLRVPNIRLVFLRESGLISYSRGEVQVLDRKGSEEAFFDCYQIILNELSQLRQKTN